MELVDILISGFTCIWWCFIHYVTFPYKFHAVMQNTCKDIFKCPMLFHMYRNMFYTRGWPFVVQLYLWILQNNDINLWSRALLEKLIVTHVIFNFECFCYSYKMLGFTEQTTSSDAWHKSELWSMSSQLESIWQTYVLTPWKFFK